MLQASILTIKVFHKVNDYDFDHNVKVFRVIATVTSDNNKGRDKTTI